jgi:hypothetical protein
MKKTLSAMEPEALFSTWLPAGVQSFEQWQKFLWGRLTGQSGDAEEAKKP